MIDPEAVARLETKVREATKWWPRDSTFSAGGFTARELPIVLDLIAENKRLREALERIRDSQESDLGEYATFAQAEAIVALEGGQGA